MAKERGAIMKDVIPLDKELHNADWTKQSWDLPPYKSEEFMEYLKSTGKKLSDFKKLPVYKQAVKKGLIVKDKWVE
jgi:uncharacterized coiled-coil DUF342 family protein